MFHMMPMGMLHWGLFFGGSVFTAVLAYILGRTDAKRRLMKIRDSWVVVNPRGIFGYEIFEEHRSRANAERDARRFRPNHPNVQVITKTAWREQMTAQWTSDAYWDAVDNVEEQVARLNERIAQDNPAVVETTVLPVLAEEKPLLRVDSDGKVSQIVTAKLSQVDVERLDEIRIGIHEVQARSHHVDEVLRTLQESMDEFRYHLRAIRRITENNAKDTRSITEELRAILDEDAADADVPQHSGEAGRPDAGSAHPAEA